MSGRFFLDTNAIVDLLKGNQEVVKLISDASFIACSVISEIEYISFPDISEKDIALFSEFLSRITVFDLRHGDPAVKELISRIRKTRSVKLPDAVILAYAKTSDCTLITADKKIASVGEFVSVQTFTPLVEPSDR